MSFAKILKDLRKEKNLSAKNLADLLGFSTNVIYEWEHDRCEPSIDCLKKLSRVFDVSTDYLIGASAETGTSSCPNEPLANEINPLSNLLLLRKERNLTQLDIAKAINTTQSNIGRWEKGINEPASSYLIALADFFNCSIDYLVGREDDLGNIVSTAPSTAPQDIFGDEATLLSCFRKLGTYEKEAILIQIKALAELSEKNTVRQPLNR